MLKEKESSVVFIGIMALCGLFCVWHTTTKASDFDLYCNKGNMKCIESVNRAISAVRNQKYNPLTAINSCKKESCKKRHQAEAHARNWK
mgnify:CR=1 FL=1